MKEWQIKILDTLNPAQDKSVAAKNNPKIIVSFWQSFRIYTEQNKHAPYKQNAHACPSAKGQWMITS